MAQSIDSKIEEKQRRITMLKERIANDRRAISQLEQEIDRLEAQRIIGLVNKLNIPFSKLEETIKKLQTA